jgi:outer membrane protein
MASVRSYCGKTDTCHHRCVLPFQVDQNDGRETLPLKCRMRSPVLRIYSLIWLVLTLTGCFFQTLTCYADETSDQEAPVILRGQAQSTAYTLPQVLEETLRTYPRIREQYERALAAKGQTSLAKTAYLPQIDTTIQEIRATENSIPGVLFPQSTIPFITHPEAAGTRFAGFWDSNMGTLFTQELWDFGLRHANVQLAYTGAAQAGALTELTKFDACLASSEAFLLATGADEVVRAHEANLRAREAFAHQVHTLVDTGLRPGVDAARADAEIARAQNQLYEAQRTSEMALVNVSQAMGNPSMNVRIKTNGLVNSMPPQTVFSMPDFEKHPMIVLNEAQIRTVQSRIKVLDKTWYPHVFFEGALSGRGTSTPGFGTRVAGGVLPQVANWAAGFRISFPLEQVWIVRAQKRIESHNLQAQRANYDQSVLELRAKEANARIQLEKARQIAQNTPKFVEAARQTEMQSEERYKVGLNTVVDVAEAQRLLVEAEVDNAVAQVGVWRAHLQLANASGDLKPFVELVTRAEVLNK